MKDIKAQQIGGNLDATTRRRLICINNECMEQVIRRLRGHSLMKEFLDDTQMQQAMAIMGSSKTPDEVKRKLKAMMAKGAFDPVKQKEVDKLFETELDLCITTKVNAAIRRGELKPPKHDDFSQKMMRRMQGAKQ